jgi:hypothetical protein
MHVELPPIEHQFGAEPLPTVARTSETRDRFHELLTNLGINMSLDVNRSRRAAQAHVYRFRKAHMPEAQYRVRELRPGWSRIWRVK